MAAVIAIGVFAAASARPLARAPLAPLRARAHMILPRDDASWPWEPRLDAELVDLESRSDARTSDAQLAAAATAAALGGGLLLVPPEAAIAQSQAGTVFDPSTFQPVCSVSDGVYRSLQTFIAALIGSQGYTEYAPLVASGLLRVRLELCVVESFINEAIIPFVRERGISWVLPLHETTETFVAGVVFSVAANFILIGSTKLITVLFTYADLFVGLPLRLVGGVAWCAHRRAAPRAVLVPVPAEQACEPPPPRPPAAGTRQPSRCSPSHRPSLSPARSGSACGG